MKKYKTQAEVDAAIDRFIRLEHAAEVRRDRQEYESAEYWRHHDIVLKWRESAVRLMPKGS